VEGVAANMVSMSMLVRNISMNSPRVTDVPAASVVRTFSVPAYPSVFLPHPQPAGERHTGEDGVHDRGAGDAAEDLREREEHGAERRERADERHAQRDGRVEQPACTPTSSARAKARTSRRSDAPETRKKTQAFTASEKPNESAMYSLHAPASAQPHVRTAWAARTGWTCSRRSPASRPGPRSSSR
jgi:hypothetical protein